MPWNWVLFCCFMPVAPIMLCSQTGIQTGGVLVIWHAGQTARSRAEPLSQIGLLPSFTPSASVTWDHWCSETSTPRALAGLAHIWEVLHKSRALFINVGCKTCWHCVDSQPAQLWRDEILSGPRTAEVKVQHLSTQHPQWSVLLVWVGLKMEAQKIIFENKDLHLAINNSVPFFCISE